MEEVTQNGAFMPINEGIPALVFFHVRKNKAIRYQGVTHNLLKNTLYKMSRPDYAAIQKKHGKIMMNLTPKIITAEVRKVLDNWRHHVQTAHA